jgi:hypothetical protein
MVVRDIFVIMPFTEQTFLAKDGQHRVYTQHHFDDVYAEIKLAVHEFRPNCRVDRMEQPYGNLLAAIIKRLSSADVVIAVLSGRNPNVFYELGVRHSLRRNTIMLVENRDEYPFDMQPYFSHQFSVEHDSDRDQLRLFIKKRLVEFDQAALPDSPVIDVLQLSEFEQLRVLNAWETRRAAVVMEGVAREAVGVLGLIQRTVEDTRDLHDKKRRKRLGLMRLSWDVIDGFTKNRPIPGLPAAAYRDAEAIYALWREMGHLWNSTVQETRKKPDMATLQQIAADAHRRTLAYLFDLIAAWKDVMDKQVSFGIPWPSSGDSVIDLIQDTPTLMAVHNELVDELLATDSLFSKFDKQFVGVPPLLLDAMNSSEGLGSSGAVPAFPNFREFVSKAAKNVSRRQTRKLKKKANRS